MAKTGLKMKILQNPYLVSWTFIISCYKQTSLMYDRQTPVVMYFLLYVKIPGGKIDK